MMMDRSNYTPARIAICVCTCRRPKMLWECLESLASLTGTPGAVVSIIVVDNEPEASVNAVEAASWFGAHYFHEPRRGIPQARNKALDAARMIGATHVAFIDDDERADKDWLVTAWEAMQEFRADVVQGYVRYIYPSDAQKWRVRGEYNFKKQKTGDLLEVAITNNVLFALNARAAGIRFDETLSLLGGEDIVFFDAYFKRGAKIVFCREAVTLETVPWSRLTIKVQCMKAYRKGFCRINESRLTGNPLRIHVIKLIKRTLGGLLKIVASPLAFAFGSNAGLRAIMSGGRNLAFVAGTIAAMIGVRPIEYYRHPQGY